MRRLHGIAVVLVLSLVWVAALAQAGSIEEKLTYQGNKARIAVGRIKSKASKCTYRMAESLGEMLSTALTNNDRFIVLASGEDLAEIAQEVQFGQSGMVEKGKAPQKGLMEGADVIITGAITMFEPNAKGIKFGLHGLSFKKNLLGGTRVKAKKAIIGLDLKLIDVRQRRIIYATKVEGKSTSWGVGGLGGGWGRSGTLVGDLGVYSKTPMEKAIRVLIDKVVNEIATKLPSEYYRYKGKGKYTKQYAQAETTQASTQTAAGPAARPVATSEPTPSAEMKVRKRGFDFVPGQKTLWIDDLAGDEVGDFPFKNNLDTGTFEVVEIAGQKWIMATSPGRLLPKTGKLHLPERYTLQLELYLPKTSSSWPGVTLEMLGRDGRRLARLEYFTYGANFWLKGKQLGRKDEKSFYTKGLHYLRMMVTKRAIKVYVDETRIANVPNPGDFKPASFAILVHGGCTDERPVYFSRFRIAEASK